MPQLETLFKESLLRFFDQDQATVKDKAVTLLAKVKLSTPFSSDELLPRLKKLLHDGTEYCILKSR